MKKILSIFVVMLSMVSLAACVTIANTAPVLSGEGFDAEGHKSVTIDVGDNFDPLNGVTAIDDRDGNITADIVVSGWDEETNTSPGTHTIVLRVSDKEGLESTLTIELTVRSEDPDARPPIFEGVVLDQTHYIGGGTWNPLDNITAWENEDKEVDITDQIQVRDQEGVAYNLDVPGNYPIRLRVTNQAGIQANVTITLRVVQPDIPTTLPTTPVEVELWHAMGGDITSWLKQAALDFRAEYAALGYDFTVIIPTGTGTYDSLRAKMSNAIIERELPNMVQGYPDHVAEYLNGGAILNLNPYIEHTTYGLHGADALSDILEAYRLENQQYFDGGTYYSLPFNKSSEVLMYNKNALAYAGITDPEDLPTTWQGWFAIADQLIAYGKTKNPTEQNLVKAGSYDSSGNGFITFTRQFDGAYTSINLQTFRGQYLWHENANTFAAMQFVKDNRDVFVTPDFWAQEYATTPFAEQKVAFNVGSSAGVRHNQNAVDALPVADRFEIGVAPVPYNADKPANRAVIQQGTNISLTNSGTRDEKLVSWLFLKYLMRTEVTVDFAIETGYFPVRESGFNDPRYISFINQTLPGMSSIQKANALAADAAFKQRNYFFYDPAFVGSSRARIEVGLAFQTIITGDGNIQAALDRAFREASLGS
ncbi:MAG: extracellular solute-binding protein [Acholeplasmataceae bacterium]|nr:extracellular solute-binding protein [Acholeplasmataceae bacterium]